jgi:hypothetical protein
MAGQSAPSKLTGAAGWVATAVNKIATAAGLVQFHPRSLARRHLERTVRRRVVLAGPFQALRYVDTSVGSALEPKVLGTYEVELHSVVEEICASPPELIVDVGAAEGYYAVGFAKRCPHSRVVAFELAPEGRSLIAQLSRENGVETRILIQGACSRVSLAGVINGERDCVVIVDAEGAELELLDLEAVPALRRCRILVEMHPQFKEDIVHLITSRFDCSHKQRLIKQRARSVDDLPFHPLLRLLLGRWLILASTEYRPVAMSWLWLTPKAPTTKTAQL